LAGAADHDALQLGISRPGLDHQPDLRVALHVEHLLRLAVGGHVEGAVLGEIIHRDDMREPVLVDGRQRAFAHIAKKLRLLLGSEADVRTFGHGGFLMTSAGEAYGKSSRIGASLWRLSRMSMITTSSPRTL